MVIATLFISLAVLIVIGAPIAVCIGFAPIAALVAEIRRLGGQAEELPDGIAVTPVPLTGARWESYADHRMATTGALIGLRVPGVTIDDIGTTAKTLPEFTQLWEGMLTR